MAREGRERLTISELGEYYRDLLQVSATLSGDKGLSGHAKTLIQDALAAQEELLWTRVKYLGRKRGISAAEMWQIILQGDYRRMDDQE